MSSTQLPNDYLPVGTLVGLYPFKTLECQGVGIILARGTMEFKYGEYYIVFTNSKFYVSVTNMGAEYVKPL